MNIVEYKEAMIEIPVNTEDVKAMLLKKMKEENTYKGKDGLKKFIPVCSIVAIIMVVILVTRIMYSDNYPITITVYAAEVGEVSLSDDPVSIKLSANFYTGGYYSDLQGNPCDARVNFNIKFNCVGQDIDNITYSCSDKEVTRANKSRTSAYYVENIIMPLEEYLNRQWFKDETFLYGSYGEGEEKANLTKLIGSSYTVDYDEQLNKQYGLEMPATVDEDNNFHIKDLIIKVTIQMKDGSVQHKKLIVHQGNSAFTEVEIRIL